MNIFNQLLCGLVVFGSVLIGMIALQVSHLKPLQVSIEVPFKQCPAYHDNPKGKIHMLIDPSVMWVTVTGPWGD